VTYFYPGFGTVGGGELLAASQLDWLRDRGVDVSVVTYDLDEARWGRRLEGIPVTVVPRRSWRDLFAVDRPIPKLRLRARRAARHLQDGDVVLTANHPCSTMLGQVETPARRLWQCNEPPRRIHLRGANPFLAARVDATGGKGIEDACAPFARRLAAPLGEIAAFDVESVSRLDGIFAISAFSRDNARRIYGRCSEEVVPPIVRFPGAVSPRAGLDRTGLQVLVHTRLEVLKNVDTLLRGFARFRAAACPGARIHLVGEGQHRPRLEALAAELGLGDVARFHGFLPEAELRKVYAACDVFALLPLDEPFGMVFPEAAAQGLLLVGPDHGGPVEILEGGELGFPCDAFDPDALAEALARIWALDDAEVDRRRVATDRACRARYAADEVGPRLLRALGQPVPATR